MCEYTAVAEGECCPRCVTDPCLADNLSYDIRQTCQDPAGAVRLSGDTWHMPNSPCTTCKCKVGQRNNNHNEGLLYCAASMFDLTRQTSTKNPQQIMNFTVLPWYPQNQFTLSLFLGCNSSFTSSVGCPSLQMEHYTCCFCIYKSHAVTEAWFSSCSPPHLHNVTDNGRHCRLLLLEKILGGGNCHSEFISCVWWGYVMSACLSSKKNTTKIWKSYFHRWCKVHFILKEQNMQITVSGTCQHNSDHLHTFSKHILLSLCAYS